MCDALRHPYLAIIGGGEYWRESESKKRKGGREGRRKEGQERGRERRRKYQSVTAAAAYGQAEGGREGGKEFGKNTKCSRRSTAATAECYPRHRK